MLEGGDRGDIVPQVFQARSYAGYARVGWSERIAPTQSCRRSVVDDNGNPIFRNNICLEDRRLTSLPLLLDMYICAYTYACSCTKCSISTMTSFVISFHPFSDVGC